MKHFYVIGDSMTGAKLQNLKHEGETGGVGWAEYIAPLFNQQKCQWHNKCCIGWAIRDFFNRGKCYPNKIYLEEFIFKKMNPNADNTLFACFGTLEGAKIDLKKIGWKPELYFGPRGSIPGLGYESRTVFDDKYKEEYVVYTFGEYLRRLITLCEQYNTDLYFLTPPARYTWKDERHHRGGSLKYSDWMKQIANEYNIKLLDNNTIFSNYLDSLGQEKCKELFAIQKGIKPKKEHTTPKGAKKFAELVRDGLVREYPETFRDLL